MTLDERDRQLRLTLFAHIGRLRDVHGGAIPAAKLTEGMTFEGQRQPIWNQQKGIYKPQWLGRDGAALTIQTSFESPYDDRLEGDGADDGRFIYRYRGTKVDHPDNRALRRAHELGRPLLYLIARAPGIYEPEFPFYVVGDRPDDLAFELMADAPGNLAASFDRPMTDNILLKSYATRLVRQRLHQGRFRYLVLFAYRSQCSVCRLRHEKLLDAAHIIPDRDQEGHPRVANGLSLCKIHHSAYDYGILGISPDYRVHVREDVLAEVDGPMLRHGLQEMNNAKLSVPRRADQKPDPELLDERFRAFRAA